jgi:hypothetical protein
MEPIRDEGVINLAEARQMEISLHANRVVFSAEPEEE